MKQIITPAQMTLIDEYAITALNIPSMQLMERAGDGVVNEILTVTTSLRKKKKPQDTAVVIFCGRGNNGGDGFVAARMLAEKNYSVTVVTMGEEKELSTDAMSAFRKMRERTDIEVFNCYAFLKLKNRTYDIIIDAMLGTAFRGALHGIFLQAVHWCNKRNGVKVAVDIPTGLNGETGAVLSDAFRADVTVTMSNPKSGFYYGRAKDYTGDVVVADIGIPPFVIKKYVQPSGVSLIEARDVKELLPKRPSDSHKHSVGKLFALAGSKGMMGAALLCSQSAMRSGAGQVILGIPESEYSVVAKRTLEVMPLGLPSTKKGSISDEALDEIQQRISWATVLVLGCGLSRHKKTSALVREIISTSSKPMVIDADGLYALSGHLGLLKSRRVKDVVLTPHMGEFALLANRTVEEIEQDKYAIASAFAKMYKIVLVLKGAPTIVVTPRGKIFVNPTGNPGMSTAGSGDVLAGIIASLMGQKNNAVDAAVNGVYIHGRSGDLAAKRIGTHGMIASDMIKFIPAAIKELTVPS